MKTARNRHSLMPRVVAHERVAPVTRRSTRQNTPRHGRLSLSHPSSQNLAPQWCHNDANNISWRDLKYIKTGSYALWLIFLHNDCYSPQRFAWQGKIFRIPREHGRDERGPEDKPDIPPNPPCPPPLPPPPWGHSRAM